MTWVAKPPSRVYPVNTGLSHRFSRSPRQYAQTPHVAPSHATPTRSSMANPPTPGPSALTRPTISWPGTIGSTGFDSSPSTTCRSVRQTPQAVTVTMIRSEEHTSELQSLRHLVCRLLLEKKKITIHKH